MRIRAFSAGQQVIAPDTITPPPDLHLQMTSMIISQLQNATSLVADLTHVEPNFTGSGAIENIKNAIESAKATQNHLTLLLDKLTTGGEEAKPVVEAPTADTLMPVGEPESHLELATEPEPESRVNPITEEVRQ
jgi:hypothetical protein